MAKLPGIPPEEWAKEFDAPLRHYPIRREWPVNTLNLSSPNDVLQQNNSQPWDFNSEFFSVAQLSPAYIGT
jgi:hypothetical protein